MKEIKYYRTYSYREDKQLEARNFETPELAKDDAISDITNTDFSLYEINMVFDGKIIESRKYIGSITCGKDLEEFAKREKIRIN